MFINIPTLRNAAIVAFSVFTFALQEGGRDSVVLKSGGSVDGWIVQESDGLIVLELSPGARIEVNKSDVASVHRATVRPESSPSASRPALKPELLEEWWTLRDSRGDFVGTRQVLRRPSADLPGGVQLEEMIDLQDFGKATVRIWRTEIVDSAGRPVQCQYRETWAGGSASVHANVNNGMLEVETIDPEGRLRTTVPFPAEATFPLLFMERARASKLRPGESFRAEVYDPFTRSPAVRVARGAATGPIAFSNESPSYYNCFVIERAGIASAHWVNSNGTLARVELNGPDLVATRCSREETHVARANAAEASFVARDRSGRIKLLIPGSDWKPGTSVADAVSLERNDGGARVIAFAFDLDRDTTASGAVSLFERRLRVTFDRYERIGGFDAAEIHQLPAHRFEFRYETARGLQDGIAIIVARDGRASALMLTYDKNDRARAEREFERVISRADLGY